MRFPPDPKKKRSAKLKPWSLPRAEKNISTLDANFKRLVAALGPERKLLRQFARNEREHPVIGFIRTYGGLCGFGAMLFSSGSFVAFPD